LPNSKEKVCWLKEMGNSIQDLPKAYDGLLSVIVPCKSEAQALPIFYAEFLRVMKEMGNPDFELIFVEDGSTDNTLEILRTMSKEDARVRYISFSRNFGKEAAMCAGMKYSAGDYLTIMDADLQDPPSLLPQMFAKMKETGCDCVATRRKNREGEPKLRSFLARAFYKVLNSTSDLKFTEGARDYRLIKRKVADEIMKLPEYNRFLKGIYEWVGFKTEWIEFDNIERCAGQTKWSLPQLCVYSLNALTSFSTVPLAIAAIVGILFCLLSSAAIILLSIRQLIFHNSAYGWTSLVCIIFFLCGLQLFCLGMIGQYAAKIYLETKNRPQYIVSEVSPNRKNSDQ
jgi:glucosyltransferase